MSRNVSLTQGFGRATNDIKQSFANFRNSNFIRGSKEFLNSNSLVAKVAFLVLVLICFVFLLRLGTAVVSWFLSPPKNPKVVDGMIKGTQQKVVPQDPKSKHAVTILRSSNQTDGIEFTWSVWLYIEDLKDQGKYKHIFHKGNDNIQTSGDNTGMNYPNNAPGLYLGKDSNNLNSFVIAMNTYDPSSTSSEKDMNEIVIINDITLHKWMNVMIRVDGRNLDVYINGTIAKRHVLNGVAKQNYGDVYVNMNGGFDGFLSDLWYHDYGLNASEIQKIVSDGPNMKMDTSAMKAGPPYYSLNWYFDQ